jgi:3-methyladenine DNA glycosylase AlkD
MRRNELESEIEADRKMAYEWGWCLEMYYKRIAEEEAVEKDLENLSIRENDEVLRSDIETDALEGVY